MSDPSEAPYYRPAPYLLNRSFLSAEQLVYYFNDFYASIKNISAAPELVFERLVANLSEAFATKIPSAQVASEPAREDPLKKLRVPTTPSVPQEQATSSGFNSKLESINDQLEAASNDLKTVAFNRPDHKDINVFESYNRELQLSSNRLGVLVASLQMTYTQLNEEINICKWPVLLCKNPDIGRFNARWSPGSDQSTAKSRTILFANPYRTPLLLPLGINSFEYGGEGPLNVTTSASNIQGDSCEITISTPYTMNADATGCTWPEIEPNNADFQCGSINFSTIDRSHTSTQYPIKFQRQYNTNPNVIVYLNSFGFSSDKNWILAVKATNITRTGFILYIDHPHDSSIVNAGVSWVSCSTEKREVFVYSEGDSGCIGNEASPSLFGLLVVSMVAINKIEILKPHKLKISVWASISESNTTKWIVNGLPTGSPHKIGSAALIIS